MPLLSAGDVALEVYYCIWPIVFFWCLQHPSPRAVLHVLYTRGTNVPVALKTMQDIHDVVRPVAHNEFFRKGWLSGAGNATYFILSDFPLEKRLLHLCVRPT